MPVGHAKPSLPPFPAKPSLLPQFYQVPSSPPVERQAESEYPMNNYSSDYPDLIAALKPIVKACGMAVLNQLPNAKLFAQVQSRSDVLATCRDNLVALIRETRDSARILSALDRRDTARDLAIFKYMTVNFSHFPNYSRAPQAPSVTLSSVYESVSAPLSLSLSDALFRCDAEISMVAQVYSQLDIYNTIDHSPIGDRSFVEAFGCSDVKKFWSDYIKARPAKLLYDEYYYFKKPGLRDEVSDTLVRGTMAMRRAYTVERVLSAMDAAYRDGWFVVFDTLTLADDKLAEFYKSPTLALRDHFRNVRRLCMRGDAKRLGVSCKLSKEKDYRDEHGEWFQYFCVPEYGSEKGRLHFHALYLMRSLPVDTVDPNAGRRVRNLRQVPSLQSVWGFGHSMPISVRYAGDAFGRAGWLTPVKPDGKPIDFKPPIAVALYVAKYVNKKVDADLYAKGLGGLSKWNSHLKSYLKSLPKGTFRVRMSRGFGAILPTMEHLSLDSLVQATNLHHTTTLRPMLMRSNAKKMLRSRLATMPVFALQDSRPPVINLLKHLRDMMQKTEGFNLQSFIATMTQRLLVEDISDELREYIERSGLTPPAPNSTAKVVFAGK